MLQELGGATVIGPLIVGLDKPVQIVSLGAQGFRHRQHGGAGELQYRRVRARRDARLPPTRATVVRLRLVANGLDDTTRFGADLGRLCSQRAAAAPRARTLPRAGRAARRARRARRRHGGREASCRLRSRAGGDPGSRPPARADRSCRPSRRGVLWEQSRSRRAASGRRSARGSARRPARETTIGRAALVAGVEPRHLAAAGSPRRSPSCTVWR